MIKGEDKIVADILKIVFNERCITKYIHPEYGDDWPTFDDIVKIAEENGYKEGTITLIADNALDGKVYIYGNYEPKEWYEYGKTMGYA